MAGPPVVRFARTAVAPIEREPEEIKAELVAVRSARQNLLGIEELSRTALDERAHRLNHDLKFMESGYKRLSLEPLTWTKSWSVWPMFAIYPLHSPHMILRSDRVIRNNGGPWLADRWPGTATTIPEPIQKIYRRHQQRMGDNRITSTFQGVIPSPVREDIKKAKPLFKVDGDRSDIFLIGEANWVEGHEPEPPPLRHYDPLVVGWDGNDLWLISHFDLTSIERYMMDEFPALPEHTNSMRLPEHK